MLLGFKHSTKYKDSTKLVQLKEATSTEAVARRDKTSMETNNVSQNRSATSVIFSYQYL